MPSRSDHQVQPTVPTPKSTVEFAGGGGRDSAAVARLGESCGRSAGTLSVGLEPCRAYLPASRADTPMQHERFLMEIVEATAGIAAAYKFNLAHFEAMGPEGWALLHRVRKSLPKQAYVIADAKRGDIGTTAERYAEALFGTLGADATTVNPLMGRDSVEPFLKWKDKLTFVLALTSNPGAADFLLPEGLYRRIAQTVVAWAEHGNCGLVVGATRGDEISEVREAAPIAPFLVPGIGAQGGEIESVIQRGGIAGRADRWNGLLFHVTRGVLPVKGEESNAVAAIRQRAEEWRARISAAGASAEAPANRGVKS